jgi:hypothetical protein
MIRQVARIGIRDFIRGDGEGVFDVHGARMRKIEGQGRVNERETKRDGEGGREGGRPVVIFFFLTSA